jgi:hypothetical protein
MIKPGYKTSEFWFTLVSFLFSGLYLLGILNDHSQKEDLIQETSRGLEALILIIGQLSVLFRYIKGRTEIKKIYINTDNKENNIKPVTTKKKTTTTKRKNIKK